MKKQLTLTTLVLCAALISGTSWAGPCAGGANPGPGEDCRSAYLIRWDLRSRDLQNANLSEANLFEADLRRTNLQGANLQGANLQFTQMSGANLRGANLYGASLTGAFLTGRPAARGSYALPGAIFDGATWIDGRKCQAGSVGECRY